VAPWRDRYIELAKEGEAQGLTFTALGDYISQRMTDTELRLMLAEWAPVLEAARERWGSATVTDGDGGEVTITTRRPLPAKPRPKPLQDRPRVVEREARYRNDG
jgi:hypothetical protein